MNDLPHGDALMDMEPILQRRNGESPRVERSTLVLGVLAAVLVAILFLLLTSGAAV